MANSDSSTGRAGSSFIPHLPQVPFAPHPSREELLQETRSWSRLRREAERGVAWDIAATKAAGLSFATSPPIPAT